MQGDHRGAVKMPINRKLQAEMDRTLKRVAEGRAAFEELWQKLDATEVSWWPRHIAFIVCRSTFVVAWS
jgi:Not1 N-terminal domain, CCR4-Not complex component